MYRANLGADAAAFAIFQVYPGRYPLGDNCFRAI